MGVQFADGMSPTFDSLLGVKQGCPLSPTLFGIFIDDFQAELEAGSAGFALPTLSGVQTPARFRRAAGSCGLDVDSLWRAGACMLPRDAKSCTLLADGSHTACTCLSVQGLHTLKSLGV